MSIARRTPLCPFVAAAIVLCAGPHAHAIGDRENWAVAKQAAARYGVSPHLLISIRYHENPRRANDHKACGVKDPTGRRKWWPGGLSGQYHKCAEIVARHASRHGWDPQRPTRAQVSRLGQFYAEGSLSWGRSVWSMYRRMAPTATRPAPTVTRSAPPVSGARETLRYIGEAVR